MAAGREAPDLASVWWIPAAMGAVSLAIGVMAIAWPDITLLALTLLAGINIIVLSGFALIEAIGEDRGDRTLRVVFGLAGIVAGLIVLRRPSETLLLVVVAVGIWLIISGIVELIRGFVVATEHRLLRILGGVVDGVLGILLLSLPKLGLTTAAILIGLAFIVRGVLLVVAGFRLRRLAGHTPGPTPVAPTPA